MQKIFFTFFLFLLPISIFGRENFSSKEFQDTLKIVSNISGFERNFYRQGSIFFVRNIFPEREKIQKNIVQISRSFWLHFLEKPTFDISEKYTLTLQKYKLSCEIAALRMVIYSLMGESISEEEILSSIPIFEGNKQGGVWGNPEKEFVGSYTGSQRGETGYGVYEAPLAKYLTSILLESTISNALIDPYIMPSDRLRKGLEAIHSGARVILWGDWCTSLEDEDGVIKKANYYLSGSFPLSAKNFCDRKEKERGIFWYTPDGTMVQGLAGEHVFLLLGYVGPIERPTYIIVWDTDTGKHVYSYSEWMRKWGLLDFRMLIVHRNI